MSGVSGRWIQVWMTRAITQDGPAKREGPYDDELVECTARSAKPEKDSLIFLYQLLSSLSSLCREWQRACYLNCNMQLLT